MKPAFFIYTMAIGFILTVFIVLSVISNIKKSSQEIVINGWHYEDAPENVPIIAVWGLGYATRSHVCVMIRGRAYAYDIETSPVEEIMSVRPRKWRGLED